MIVYVELSFRIILVGLSLSSFISFFSPEFVYKNVNIYNKKETNKEDLLKIKLNAVLLNIIVLSLWFFLDRYGVLYKMAYWYVLGQWVIFKEIVVCALLLYSGDQLSLHYNYPTLILARNIGIDGTIRGIDAIFMTVLVASFIVKASLWLYIPVKLLGEVFNLQNRKSLVWPLVLLAVFLAITTIDSSEELGYYMTWIWPHFAITTFEVGFPIILLALAWWKREVTLNIHYDFL